MSVIVVEKLRAWLADDAPSLSVSELQSILDLCDDYEATLATMPKLWRIGFDVGKPVEGFVFRNEAEARAWCAQSFPTLFITLLERMP
jgi:hypothetical protein